MPCDTETIAPHIHVLYRDIPFILNITHPTLAYCSLNIAPQCSILEDLLFKASINQVANGNDSLQAPVIQNWQVPYLLSLIHI